MNTRDQMTIDKQLKSPHIELHPQSFLPSPSSLSEPLGGEPSDHELAIKLDSYSLEAIVEMKISRFLDQLGSFYPEDLHAMIMQKVEKPLLKQILLRTGGNQVHAARILGINRNTLRKKMRVHGIKF